MVPGHLATSRQTGAAPALAVMLNVAAVAGRRKALADVAGGSAHARPSVRLPVEAVFAAAEAVAPLDSLQGAPGNPGPST